MLSGTPLQNNLKELWSLLTFILPELFQLDDIFLSTLEQKIENEIMEKQRLQYIQHLHKILRPFILKRTKSEVNCQIPPKKEILVYIGLT